MSNQHVLKIHPAPLADLLSGAKTAEVRRNDRGFQVGDTVRLMEVNPDTGNWTGAADHVRTISHIQTGYGLPDGLCVLSYAQAEQQEAQGYNAYTEAPYSRTGKCGDNPVPQFRFEDRAGRAEWYVRLSDYRAALATQPAVQWFPMEAAPKDRRILVLRVVHPGTGSSEAAIAQWNAQPYHVKPKPYWDIERDGLDIRTMRDCPPLGWMPLPEPDAVRGAEHE